MPKTKASSFAEEHNQYKRAIAGFEILSQELDFDLVAIPYGLTDDALTQQAINELTANQVDFLLLQTATCAAGVQILQLAQVAPHPRQSGDI